MKKTLIAGLAILVMFPPLFAGEDKRTLYVEESQEIAVIPDLCIMTIVVQTKNKEVTEAYDENNRIMGKINENVKKQGLDPKDIRTSKFSLSEESHWNREIKKNVFDDYKVSHSLVVKIRDFEKIVPIMNGAIEAGATNIQQVTFVMENPKEYEKELREKTLKAVQEKAEHIAKLMGIRLGKPINIHTATAPFARDERISISSVAISAPRTVETRPIIEPGEIILYYSVRVTYEIE